MSDQFAVIPSIVLTDTNLTDKQLRLLCVLSTHADKYGRCYPSVKTLATECRCCDRIVQNNMAALVRYGYVKKVSRYNVSNGQQSNFYYIKYDGGDSRIRGEGDSRIRGRVILESPITESIRTESIRTKKEINKEKNLREFDEKYVTAEDRALFTEFLAKIRPELPTEVACWLSCVEFWKRSGAYYVSFSTRMANEKFMPFRGFICSLLPIPVQYLDYVAGGLEHRGYKKIITLQDVKQG